MINPGEYFIGDIVHVFSEENWSEIEKVSFKNGILQDGKFMLYEEIEFDVIKFPWNEGTLFDENNTPIGIVKGNIGCIKLEDLDFFHKSTKQLKNCPVKFNFDLSQCYNSVFQFNESFNLELKFDDNKQPFVKVGHKTLTPYLQK